MGYTGHRDGDKGRNIWGADGIGEMHATWDIWGGRDVRTHGTNGNRVISVKFITASTESRYDM